ncbi:sialate O-acetylesterase [Victivallis vadensis]|uniref:Sialate O-acetylesterase n=1 Tax=Victivallis vadensis TaxID=172901 RepID=A0A2U1AFM2_9BACT|nr:sialate O-acetylesterase [Victivallis vadensis]PVY35176.1 sialate O-acetylesterase [Victivallis vadensis]
MKTAKKFNFYKIFGSHMVLQRQRPILFSGTADAEKFITLAFAGKSTTVAADANGVWHAEFPALEAGGPYAAELSGDEESPVVTLNDILIGDVWMCSGQSNMEMPVWSETPSWRSADGEAVAAASNYPQLRLFNSILDRRMSPDQPLIDENGPGWELCTPKSVESFSACGFFFGRKLMQDLNIPIGLISTAWGGTDIEAWISREKYEQEGCREFLRKRDLLAASKSDEKGDFETEFNAWLQRYNACREEGKTEYTAWLQPDFDDSDWESNSLIFPLLVPGEKIFRCAFELPREMAGKELTLSLGTLNDVDETYLNGVLIGKTYVDVPAYWSVRRTYTIPAGVAKAGRNVLAVINDNHYSSGGFTPERPVKITVTGHPEQQVALTQWRAKIAFLADLEKIGIRPTVEVVEQNIPCTLFNGMMYPWFKYPVRGVIWYQGCNNTGRKDYYVHHRYLIEDWRQQWNEPELPFFLVQLAGFAEHCPENRGEENRWQQQEPEENPPYALTREIQAEMPKLYDNVGMAVTMDIGDQYDIHPSDKKTLGYRLACEAERMVYAMQRVSQGPEFDRFVVENGKARVFFKHTEGGLCTRDGKAPGAFALAGKDGKLQWAEAEIDGDTVLVSSPVITEPVRVRYAYAGYRGDCNLMNGAGFPAVPFRSDKGDYNSETVR